MEVGRGRSRTDNWGMCVSWDLLHPNSKIWLRHSIRPKADGLSGTVCYGRHRNKSIRMKDVMTARRTRRRAHNVDASSVIRWTMTFIFLPGWKQDTVWFCSWNSWEKDWGFFCTRIYCVARAQQSLFLTFQRHAIVLGGQTERDRERAVISS